MFLLFIKHILFLVSFERGEAAFDSSGNLRDSPKRISLKGVDVADT